MILAIDGDGRLEMATFGRTPMLCTVAKKLGDIGFDAIERYISDISDAANARSQPERSDRLDDVVGGKD